MGRAGYRVFIDAYGGGEEAGDVVVVAGGGLRAAGYDRAADTYFPEGGEIGLEGADFFFGIYLNQIIELRTAGAARIAYPQSGLQGGHARSWFGRLCGEIHFDPIAGLSGGQDAGTGVESRGLLFGKMPVLPE